MKLLVGDQVLVTAGKDKGKKGAVLRVLPEKNRVVVEGANHYVKHMKPMGDRPGQKLSLPRPLPTASVAIINEKGERDRIGYQIASDGTKTRIFKKTGAAIPKPARRTLNDKEIIDSPVSGARPALARQKKTNRPKK